MKPKQTSFLPALSPLRTAYGGGTEKGRRKTTRPFSTKLPMHFVFRAVHARGENSLLTRKNKHLIANTLDRLAAIYYIKVYRFQNVGNHLHMLIQTKSRSHPRARKNLTQFLKRFSGEIAMKVTGAKKGQPFAGIASQTNENSTSSFQKKTRFWDEVVYSRLISWGREFETLKNYFIKNLFEASGLWNRKKYPDWQLVSVQQNSS